MTTLNSWIEKRGGASAVAKMLGMTARGVRVWMRGEGPPRINTVMRLVRLSKGELTFMQIAIDSRRNMPKAKRFQ